jgi:hypothetical protein
LARNPAPSAASGYSSYGSSTQPRITADSMKCCLLLVALILWGPAPAAAQGHAVDAKVDCTFFSKKADGTWFLGAQTTIEIGTSKITLPPGDIGPRMFQFGMADLHSVLENACADKKAEPPQGPKSEKETIR